jgi:hypothetical protein
MMKVSNIWIWLKRTIVVESNIPKIDMFIILLIQYSCLFLNQLKIWKVKMEKISLIKYFFKMFKKNVSQKLKKKYKIIINEKEK